MKEIAGQGHIHTTTQPCLHTRPHEADHQSGTYTYNNTTLTLPIRPHEADCWSGTYTHNYTTLPTRSHEADQGRKKQITGQGHIHTIRQY